MSVDAVIASMVARGAARQPVRTDPAGGLPHAQQRPTSWQTFLKAHWGAVIEADFFTTDGVDVATAM